MGGFSSLFGAITGLMGMANDREYQKDMKRARDRAEAQALEQANAARRQAKAAEEAMNRANPKRPNVASALSEAEQAGKQGASGTLLTGAQGVDPNSLTLGKKTLLGG